METACSHGIRLTCRALLISQLRLLDGMQVDFGIVLVFLCLLAVSPAVLCMR